MERRTLYCNVIASFQDICLTLATFHSYFIAEIVSRSRQIENMVRLGSKRSDSLWVSIYVMTLPDLFYFKNVLELE